MPPSPAGMSVGDRGVQGERERHGVSFGRRRTSSRSSWVQGSTWTPGAPPCQPPPKRPRPKAVLVSVQLSGVTDAEQQSSLKELKRLCQTLGFEVVGQVTQKRQGLGAATLLGKGKLVELAAWTGGTGVVPKGPPGKKKATEEGRRGGRDRTAAPRGAARAHRGAARHRRRRRPRAVASPAPQHRARDLGRGGPGSHGRDHRDLPPPRVEPTGAAAGRDRAAHLRGAPVARDRRRRRASAAASGKGRAGSPPWSSIAARSATASPSSRRSWPPSTASRRRGGRGVRRRCASRWSATPTPASRR